MKLTFFFIIFFFIVCFKSIYSTSISSFQFFVCYFYFSKMAFLVFSLVMLSDPCNYSQHGANSVCHTWISLEQYKEVMRFKTQLLLSSVQYIMDIGLTSKLQGNYFPAILRYIKTEAAEINWCPNWLLWDHKVTVFRSRIQKYLPLKYVT